MNSHFRREVAVADSDKQGYDEVDGQAQHAEAFTFFDGNLVAFLFAFTTRTNALNMGCYAC
jgi:hypothetical protein